MSTLSSEIIEQILENLFGQIKELEEKIDDLQAENRLLKVRQSEAFR